MKIKRKVHQVSREPIAPKVPPIHYGLTQIEVKARTQKGWVNTPVDSPTPTLWDIVVGQSCTLFNFIFLVLGGLLMMVGSYTNLLFLLVAAINTIIGIIQQLRAKRELDALTLLAQPTVTVLRQGQELSLSTHQLVRDDLIMLIIGNQIPADGTILQGNIQLNEALLTGECLEIEKGEGDSLLSGSFVVAGTCWAVLTAVGEDSYVAQLTKEAKEMGAEGKSEMMASLDRLIRLVPMILVPVGLILFGQQWMMLGLSLRESVEGTVGALVGMIPEGLYLLTSVALAMGVMRLTKKQVLTRDMNSIETLASVDVLCVDKTGTMTTPHMTVTSLTVLDDMGEDGILNILSAMAVGEGNETHEALQRYLQSRVCPWTVTDAVPFSSRKKWQGVALEGQGCYVLGAPDWMAEGDYGQDGGRTLLLAQYQRDKLPEGESLEQCWVKPMALLLFANPIRPQAAETFDYFTTQGVTIKVISGDSPKAVARVAVEAGIPNGAQCVDTSGLSEEEVKDLVSHYTVFGRVTPQQKKWLVEGLQQQGHTVAMTGDGINDVLALKEADCGIAMASGSEATCQVANLVLLENDFSKLPAVVNEGRRVVGNITRSATLFLVKNIFSLVLALTSLIVGMGYPLEPIQLTLVGWFTIGPPSFLLALERCSDPVEGRFLTRVLIKALPGGITDGILGTIILLMGGWLSLSSEVVSTVTTFMILAVGLMVLYGVCTPFHRWRRVIWGLMVTGAVLTVIFFGSFFALVPLSGVAWYLLVGVLVGAYPLLQLVGYGVETLWKGLYK